MYRYLHRAFIPAMRVRFEFRKFAQTHQAYRAGSADGRVPQQGSVSLIIVLSKIKYGPYATGIQTSRTAWAGRSAKRLSDESRDLIRALTAYQALVEEAHQNLVGQAEQTTPTAPALIDGELIRLEIKRLEGVRAGRLADLATASGAAEMVSLVRVHWEFLAVRKTLVEPLRRRRRPDQISPGTYRGYANRWILISSYLTHLGRPSFPVLSVSYSFAEELRTYLLGQAYAENQYYDITYVNKVIGYLKMLLTYAQSRNYVASNVLLSLSCRAGSRAHPKPLAEAQMHQIETMALSPHQRHVCDSWLVAAELCLHYADYMDLPTMKFVILPEEQGRLIVHDRNKQNGTSLVQTVNVTPRAERLLAKWGGPDGLYRGQSASFSKVLKQVARLADLRWPDGEPIDLQFGMGRDTGLTARVIDGATEQQLLNMGGWGKAGQHIHHYVGNATAVVAGFVKQTQKRNGE